MSESQLSVKDRNQQVIQTVFVDQGQLLADAMDGAKNITPAKLKSTFMQVALRQPKIWQCTQQSILETVMLAARLDLDPSGYHNGAHFVPFFNKKIGAMELKLMLGYNALIDLMTRDGRVTSFTTGAIYADEEYEIVQGTTPSIRHIPSQKARLPQEKPIWFYAVARFPGGGFEMEVMSLAQVEAIRARSQQSDGEPWKYGFPEMGKKTVLRRLGKRVPISALVGMAIEHADEVDGFEFGTRRRVPNEADNMADAVLGPPTTPGRDATPAPRQASDEPTDEQLAGQPPFDMDHY